MEKKISIIIPCYNQGHYLPQALNSLLQQTYKNWEAIIIDDGSTESVKPYLKDFHQENIIYFHQKNKGLPAARNKGIELSTGDYIQFLDADDYLMPDKFQTQINELQQADIAYSGYFAFDHPFENIGVTTETKFDEENALTEFIMRWENGLCVPIHCFLFSKFVFTEAGTFREDLINHEDWDLHIRIATKKYKYIYNPEKFARYRVHENSMCRKTDMNLGKANVMAYYSMVSEIPLELRSYLKNKVLELYPAYDFPAKTISLLNTKKMFDLTNVTYVIPVRIDCKERLANLDFSIRYLQSHFKTNIIVIEDDKVSQIKGRYENIHHIFIQSDKEIFHRTRLINTAVRKCNTKYFCNWDADIFLDHETHIEAYHSLQRNSVVYPYNGIFHDIPQSYNKNKELKTSLIKEEDTATINPESYGGAIFFNTKDFIAGGMENENFISWGHEDNERHCRFKKLGYKIMRLNNPIYHFTHPRGINSDKTNPYYNNSVKEYEKANNKSKSDLQDYIKSWSWIKTERVDYSKYSLMLAIFDMNTNYYQKLQADYKGKKIIPLDCKKEFDVDALDNMKFDVIIDNSNGLGRNSKKYFDKLFMQVKGGGKYIIRGWGSGYLSTAADGKAISNLNYLYTDNILLSHTYGMVGFIKYLLDIAALPLMTDFNGNNYGYKTTIASIEIRLDEVIVIKK